MNHEERQGELAPDVLVSKPVWGAYVINVLLFFAIAALGAVADLETKSRVFQALGKPGEYLLFQDPDRHAVYWLCDGVFGFQTTLNEGALFGMGQGRTTVLAALSFLALSAILVFLFISAARESRFLSVTLGLITAGIIGNLYDRLGLHQLTWNHPPERIGEPVFAVRDWILVRIGTFNWPNFNIADSLLVCGVILLLLHAYFTRDDEKKEAETSASDKEPDAQRSGVSG